MITKQLLLSSMLLLMSVGMVHADYTYTGVLITTPDGATTYALTEMPMISYTSEGATITAQLFIKDRTKAVATVELKDGKILKAEWGTYISAGINGVSSDKLTSYKKNGKKYITGGKLIIIDKDGKQYNADGQQIK